MKKSHARSIQAIDNTSIHNICSGQVILNLAAAVKELVENSLDAGATNIEIILKEHGSESVEVTDNGHGVEERNFEGLTLKHHTSKLNEFSDLACVETFGFRGEALSSLCALSNMTIVTCHKNASVGTRLEYNHDGVLTKQSPTARQIGTTIILKNLFCTLPVRHKEFQNNLQKEFNKMLHLVTSYCLMCSNTKFMCINHTRKGKSLSLSTAGGSTVKDNIACIFGSKQLSSLVEFHMKPPSSSVMEEFALTMPLVQKTDSFRIEGYVSSCKHGQGRSSSDRQYFYINNRPFDSIKISRLVNEVYHSYNRHQYPFVFLNVITERSSIDVNVTPDKRQIYIQNEKLLLAIIKSSLEVLYEPELSNLQCKKLEDFQNEKNGIVEHLKKQENLGNSESFLGKIKRSLSNFSQEENFVRKCQWLSDGSKCDIDKQDFETVSKSNFFHAEEQNPSQKITFSAIPSHISEIDSAIIPSDTSEIDSAEISSDISEHKVNKKTINNEEFLTKNTPNKCDQTETHKMTDAKEFQVNKKRKNNCFQNDLSCFKRKYCRRSSSVDNNIQNMLDVFERKRQHLNCSKSDKFIQNVDNNENTSVYSHKLTQYIGVEEKQIEERNDSVENIQNNSDLFIETSVSVVEVPDEALTRSRKCVVIQFSMAKLKDSIKNQVAVGEETSGIYRKFRAKLTNLENKNAEEELKKEISKDMFARMKIVGQFNKGFIVTKLGTDLFIVDQHATDEKYNYETMKQNTILETQKLLCPQDLKLTAVNKCILLDNLHIFQKNGFSFTGVDDTSTDTAVHLISVPVSHNWSFGKEDVEEMIFMLNDCPGKMCHPSRIYQMFASRACRTSVMIGTVLSYSDMRKLINHMGDIEQPWNCPHGRPTMRHLFNMALLGDTDI